MGGNEISKESVKHIPAAKASLVLETIGIDQDRTRADNSGDEVLEKSTGSKEQFLKIHIKLPDVSDFLDLRTEKTHLVLVVDKSGSMAGNPWQQVQSSLKDILSASLLQNNVKTDLIIYADNAHVVNYTPHDYEKVIGDLKAGGMTNFKAAFTKVNRVVTEAGPGYAKTVVVFMTDGMDTVNPKGILPTMIPKLAERFRELEKNTVIHTVGFTKDHDFNFLRNLAEKGGGYGAGMFRYCEPGEDRQALKHKLDELFEFILFSTTRTMDVALALEEGNLITGIEKPASAAIIQGQIIQEDSQGAAHTDRDLKLTAEVWLHLSDPSHLPVVSLTIKTSIKSEVVEIPCEIDQIESKLLETTDEKASWRLKILSRNVDVLVAKVGTAISENGDVSQLQHQIEKYQSQITHTRVFGNGITKTGREDLFAQIKDIQQNLDHLQNMLAQYMRVGTQSISLLARAHDMRYQAVFSKSRRQRIMDKRVAKNMMQASTAQDNLANLTVDTEEVKQISQDALGFYFCMLSQNSIADILLGDDLEDAIGFGLAVKRNEVVLDEPTSISLQVISGTLVSRTAMLDALQYKIDISGHLKAHGGFSFADTPLGVTTIGTSREPINAWLPLYVTKSHWDRVKVILKPALGSFCTLDPLGYDYKQMDVLFMVLGCMIGQLSEQNVGEHQLKILFAFHRTCAACIEEFDLTEKVCETVKYFLSGPAGRTKDVIPQLYTLIGYVAALPSETMHKVFEIDISGDNRTSRLGDFWLGFITECIRRAGGSLYRETSLTQINGLIHALLHGTGNSEESVDGESSDQVVCNAAREIHRLCLCSDNGDLQVPDFDPSVGVTVPSLKVERSIHVDQAMEIWAQAECGIIKNKNQNKKVLHAKKQVQKWVEGGHVTCEVTSSVGGATGGGESEGGASTSSEANEVQAKSSVSDYDSSRVTSSMLHVLAKLHQKLCKAAYPHLASVPGCIAFINTWLSRKQDFVEMDKNSGIAPDHWIREIKKAIKRQYSDMHKFSRQMEDDKEEAETKKDTDVISLDQQVTMATAVASSSGQGQIQEPDVLVVIAKDNNDEELEEQTLVETVDAGGTSCDMNVKATGDESDSDEIESDYDDFGDDDNDDGLASTRIQSSIRKPKLIITLPMVLHCIHGNIDIPLVMRAIVCQAVKYHSNAQARAAITAKQLLDMSAGVVSARCTLELCHVDLEEHRDSVRKAMVEKVTNQRANYCMLRASTVWAFIGYLMNTYKDRGAGFSDLIDLLMNQEGPNKPPYLEEKVHVLLTGKHKEKAVLANGNLWLPEKKMAAKFKALLGEETWLAFELELRSTVQIHVYRESDIPNRHGHCNSNPYIPNILRVKLGMELLPEKYGGPKNFRAYLKNEKTS